MTTRSLAVVLPFLVLTLSAQATPKPEPISASDLQRVRKLESFLQSKLVGQRQAIRSITKLWATKVTGVGERRAILLYGPQGTGKTSVLRAAAEAMDYDFVEIKMSRFANGDVSGFRSEIEEVLKANPRTFFDFAEIEKADPSVQDAAWAISSGKDLDLASNAGKSLFAFETEVGAHLFKPRLMRQEVGYKPAPRRGFVAPISQAEVDATLRQGGVSETLVEGLHEMIGLSFPSPEEFLQALNAGVAQTLELESARHGLKFSLSNPQDLLVELFNNFEPFETSYLDVQKIIATTLEPVLAAALTRPKAKTSASVQITWEKGLFEKIMSSARCAGLLYEKKVTRLAASGA